MIEDRVVDRCFLVRHGKPCDWYDWWVGIVVVVEMEAVEDVVGDVACA